MVAEPATTPEAAVVLYRPRLAVTPFLIAINLLVFAAMHLSGVPLSGGDPMQLLHWGADLGPLTLGGQLWRLLTSNYIHFGVLHIAVNMWALWGLGHLAEEFFSGVDFALLYTFTGIGSSLFSVWLHPAVVSGGASGAVFGIAGVLLGFLRWGNVPMDTASRNYLYKQVLKFSVVNLLAGVLINISRFSRVDNWAHLGGLLTGLVAGAVIGLRPDAAPASRDYRINAWLGMTAALGLAVFLVARNSRDMTQMYRIREALQANQIDRAALLANQYVRAHPQDRSPLELVQRAAVESSLQRRDYEGAINLANEYGRQYPSDPRAAAWIGEALYAQQHYAEAAKAFNDALKLRPNDDTIMFRMADAYARAGDLAASEAAMRRMVAADPNRPGRHYNLGLALFAQKKFAESEVEVRKAQELEPHNPEYPLTLAQILLKEGRGNEAIASIRQAEQAGAPPAVVQFTLAQTFTVLGRKDDAAKALAEYKRLVQEAKRRQSR